MTMKQVSISWAIVVHSLARLSRGSLSGETGGDHSVSCFLSAGDDEITFDPDEIIENIEQVTCTCSLRNHWSYPTRVYLLRC